MARSIDRVRAAAEAAGVAIEILHMPDSTRTAEEAAAACDCNVAQIVKSLIFSGVDSGALKMLLVSGSKSADLELAAEAVGEPLERADPKRVRAETGFAIGGVSPIGHLQPIECWMDETLLDHELLWAAAGAPNAVFSIAPEKLLTMADAKRARLG